MLDFYILRSLLREVVIVEGLRVLEGHAVLVSKALGSDISGLADYIARPSVLVSVERLASLLRLVSGEVEDYLADVAWRRINAFLSRLRRLRGRLGRDDGWEVAFR